jgi:hypothetical protein
MSSLDWPEEIITGSKAIGNCFYWVWYLFALLSSVRKLFSSAINFFFRTLVGVAGAIGFVYLSGLENNIYFRSFDYAYRVCSPKMPFDRQFAIQRRPGKWIWQKQPNRKEQLVYVPILMASLAFIFGLLPLATRVGAVGNHSIRMGGCSMLSGIYRFGVFVIPVFVCNLPRTTRTYYWNCSY